MKLLTAPVLLALAWATMETANAQSLVEVARQERLRREALARRAGPDAPPPRVYTDADLIYSGLLTMRIGDEEADAGTETATAPAGSDVPAPPPDAPAALPDAPAAPPDAAATGDEERWRNRMAEARRAIEQAGRRADELQTRVNRLWADFTARDDPAQRAAIEQERQAALAELEETEAEADELARAVAAVRDEARRAGVPPGWLR